MKLNLTLNLVDAASRGASNKVRELLDGGADPNAYALDTDNHTALMIACRNSHLDVVQLLLSNGADPNVADPDGWTALFWSVHEGFGAVELLLKAGADPNVREGSSEAPGDPVLAKAIQKGTSIVVRSLLKAGANPDATSYYGEPMLCLAVDDITPDKVAILLQYGADPHQPDANGNTPIEKVKRRLEDSGVAESKSDSLRRMSSLLFEASQGRQRRAAEQAHGEQRLTRPESE